MSLSDAQVIELSELCSALIDETLNDAQRIRLEALLKEYPDARAYYIRAMAQSVNLYETAADSQTDSPDIKHINRTYRYWRISLAVGIAASVLLIVTLFNFKGTESPAILEEPVSRGVALLESMSGQEWSEGQPELRRGSVLEPGSIKLKSGLIHLRFFSGAEVVVRGPAEFKVVSAMEGECRHGTLTAQVPAQAHLFRITAPHVTVVDLGTEFGLSVQEAATEVHVFNGRVNLLAPKTETVKQDLSANQAVRISDSDAWAAQSADRNVFPSLDLLRQQTERDRNNKLKTWLAASASPRPGLAFHCLFEPDADRTVLKNVGQTSSADTHGTIVGCEWTGGRWPGKNALEFNSVGDRVRFEMAGEYPATTWAAWIRVHALPNSVNALLTFDSTKKGQYHWHISSKGEIRFGVRYKNVLEAARSPEVIKPDLLGQWIHVATTYDSATGQVLHYLNGQEVSRHTIAANVPLRLESAEIGNWKAFSGSGEALPSRNFSGRIDELMFFSHVLSSAQIQQLFAAGDPNTVDSPSK
jgi:hypothetical protein